VYTSTLLPTCMVLALNTPMFLQTLSIKQVRNSILGDGLLLVSGHLRVSAHLPFFHIRPWCRGVPVFTSFFHVRWTPFLALYLQAELHWNAIAASFA